jgi:hypothetical protein
VVDVVALSDDALQALWSISDATGVRPEYLIPVLYLESGFDSTRQNAQGAPYYGIAQTMGAHLTALGTTPAAFLTLGQGGQIRLAVAPYYASAVRTYGPIRSATRAYLANYLPARLATVHSLAQIVEPGGTAFYSSNRVALDPLRHGAITLSDLALVMGRAAAAPEARAAIARAYVLRPSERPRDAVYGQDFVDPFTGFLFAALAVTAAGAFR